MSALGRTNTVIAKITAMCNLFYDDWWLFTLFMADCPALALVLFYCSVHTLMYKLCRVATASAEWKGVIPWKIMTRHDNHVCSLWILNQLEILTCPITGTAGLSLSHTRYCVTLLATLFIFRWYLRFILLQKIIAPFLIIAALLRGISSY